MHTTDQLAQRVAEVKWLKDNGFDIAACGIYKLDVKQLGNLTIAISTMVARQLEKERTDR